MYTPVFPPSPCFHCCSVAKSRPTLCDLMRCSMPRFPAPEFAPTHVHWVGDVIQPSHLLLPPFPPALNLSQHQGLFQWVSSSHQVAKVLEHQLGHYSFQWIFRVSRSTKNNFFNNIKNKSVHIDGRWGILEKQRPSKWVPCCVNKKENLGESILLYSV